MRIHGFLMLLASLFSILPSCAVERSGHVRDRHMMVRNSPDAPGTAAGQVYGATLSSRGWDAAEPVPAGKGRVVLLRPRSPDDGGAGLIFRINDKGDFLLGVGSALAWNHPAGTCKVRFVSSLSVPGGERSLSGDRAPFFLKVSEGSTHWVLVAQGRWGTPFLRPVGQRDAQKVMADLPLNRTALPKEVEEEIPWLP